MSHAVIVQCSFANKLLNKPNCEVSSGKSTALSQDSDVEEKQASFKDLKDQQQQQQQLQPFMGSIYKTRNNTGHRSQRTSL